MADEEAAPRDPVRRIRIRPVFTDDGGRRIVQRYRVLLGQEDISNLVRRVRVDLQACEAPRALLEILPSAAEIELDGIPVLERGEVMAAERAEGWVAATAVGGDGWRECAPPADAAALFAQLLSGQLSLNGYRREMRRCRGGSGADSPASQEFEEWWQAAGWKLPIRENSKAAAAAVVMHGEAALLDPARLVYYVPGRVLDVFDARLDYTEMRLDPSQYALPIGGGGGSFRLLSRPEGRITATYEPWAGR